MPHTAPHAGPRAVSPVRRFQFQCAAQGPAFPCPHPRPSGGISILKDVRHLNEQVTALSNDLRVVREESGELRKQLQEIQGNQRSMKMEWEWMVGALHDITVAIRCRSFFFFFENYRKSTGQGTLHGQQPIAVGNKAPHEGDLLADVTFNRNGSH